MPLIMGPTGDGSEETLEMLEILNDSFMGVYGCCG